MGTSFVPSPFAPELSAANDPLGYFEGHAPLETAYDGDKVVVVAAVEDVVTFVVVGDAWFPLPLEQPTTRSAKAPTNALTENRFEDIVITMTLAMPGRFPDGTRHIPSPIARRLVV